MADTISQSTSDEIIAQAVEQFGLEFLPEDEQEDFLADLSQELTEGVLTRVVLSLDAGKSKVFAALIDQAAEHPDDENIQDIIDDFITKHVPQFNVIVSLELARLRKRYNAVRTKVEQGN